MPADQRVVYYAACSLDGFIATRDGGVEWLSGFGSADGGYDEFFAGIGSLVLGRKTFDQVLGWGWPYGSKPSAVLTTSPLPDDVPESVFASAGDNLPGLVERLRAKAPGGVWIVGGSETAGAFLRAGALEELQLAVIPIILGAGIPLVDENAGGRRLELRGTETRSNGMVELLYRVVG
jgi:dihydrofolate reductase